MTLKALVIDDDPGIVESVGEILESLGHAHDSADCVTAARDLLSRNQYDYFLLDLEIPVRRGHGLPRIQTGENLLEEILKRPEASKRPVIVMTAHGKDGPDLAVEVMKLGAVDYVTKPFPATGETLDKKINEALARIRTSTALAMTGAKSHAAHREQFRGGTMVFCDDCVELCGVRICGGRGGGQLRKALEALRCNRPGGGFVAHSGSELAHKIGCKAGQNGVAAAIRDLRTAITEGLNGAGIECGRHDVIESGGPGYRLKEWIVVEDLRAGNGADLQGHGHQVQGHAPVNVFDVPAKRAGHGARVPATGPLSDGCVPANVPVSDSDDPTNARRDWILAELAVGRELRVAMIAKELRCSTKTVKRDLAALKDEHPIEFVGPAKTGHYRVRPR